MVVPRHHHDVSLGEGLNVEERHAVVILKDAVARQFARDDAAKHAARICGHHRSTDDAQVRPVPKLVSSSRSPRATFPAARASCSAIGMVAAETLP